MSTMLPAGLLHANKSTEDKPFLYLIDGVHSKYIRTFAALPSPSLNEERQGKVFLIETFTYFIFQG